MQYEFYSVDCEKVDENVHKIKADTDTGLMVIATPYNNDNSVHWTYAITKSAYEKMKYLIF